MRKVAGLVWGGLVRIVAAWVGGGGGLVMAGWLAGRDWWLLVLRHGQGQDGGEGRGEESCSIQWRGETLMLNPEFAPPFIPFWWVTFADLFELPVQQMQEIGRVCCRLVLNLQFRRYSK